MMRFPAFSAVMGMILCPWPGVAIAKPPSPCNSRIPCAINLVGCAGETADPAGNFTINIRDLANNPEPRAAVWIDFSGCCGDIQLASVQLAPGTNVDLSTHTIQGVTDMNGNVTFCIMGAARGLSATPAAGCAKIFSNGVNMTDGTCHPSTVTVSTYDLDGGLGVATQGLNASDLGIWLNDAFSPYRARSDYDHAEAGCVSSVGPADLGKWLSVFFAAGSRQNMATAACP